MFAVSTDDLRGADYAVEQFEATYPILYSSQRVVLTSGIATIGEGLSSLEKLADAMLISPIGMWELRQTMRIQLTALDAAAS